jgi:hypothetical protein
MSVRGSIISPTLAWQTVLAKMETSVCHDASSNAVELLSACNCSVVLCFLVARLIVYPLQRLIGSCNTWEQQLQAHHG